MDGELNGDALIVLDKGGDLRACELRVLLEAIESPSVESLELLRLKMPISKTLATRLLVYVSILVFFFLFHRELPRIATTESMGVSTIISVRCVIRSLSLPSGDFCKLSRTAGTHPIRRGVE